MKGAKKNYFFQNSGCSFFEGINEAREDQRERDNFEFREEDNVQGPLTLKNIRGYYLFKDQQSNSKLERRPYYGCFIFDPQKISLFEEIKDDDTDPSGSNPAEKFKNLPLERQTNILHDHEIFVSSLNNSCPWQFMSYDIDTIDFHIPGFNNFSHEEVRLAFYLSYNNPVLFEKYTLIMDRYNIEYNHNVGLICSHDFLKLLEDQNIPWSVSSDKLNSILSEYQHDFNSDTPLISLIDKDIYSRNTSFARDPGNELKGLPVNQWCTLPNLPIPHQYEFKEEDGFKPTDQTLRFPTHAHSFDESYPLLSDVMSSKLGPCFYQKNSSTEAFDGAYSHECHITQQDENLFSLENFSLGLIPLFPPSRKMAKDSFR